MASTLVIRRFSALATGAALQRITLDAYPEDEKIEWRNLMARVQGDTCDLIEIGLTSGVSDYPLISYKTTDNSESVEIVGRIQGSGGYRIYAEFDDAAGGKMLELTACGVRIVEE